MIILDDETSTEQSPLKNPSSPVTARYDSSSTYPSHTTQSSPSTFYPSTGYSGSSSGGPPYPGQHTAPPPYQPSPPTSPSTIIIHTVPEHLVASLQEKEIRQRTFRRFLYSFLVAWFVLVVWSSIVRGVSLTIIATDTRHSSEDPPLGNGGTQPGQVPSYSLPFVRWPPVYPTPIIGVPYPSITLAVTPTPTAERLLSMAYPPPLRTAP